MLSKEADNKTSLLPERLRAAREKLGLKQQELGRLCGLGVNQISRYETGFHDPSAMTLAKLARVLGVSMDYLAGLTDDPHGQVSPSDLNIYEREVIDTFRRDGWLGLIRLSTDQLGK